MHPGEGLTWIREPQLVKSHPQATVPTESHATHNAIETRTPAAPIPHKDACTLLVKTQETTRHNLTDWLWSWWLHYSTSSSLRG